MSTKWQSDKIKVTRPRPHSGDYYVCMLFLCLFQYNNGVGPMTCNSRQTIINIYKYTHYYMTTYDMFLIKAFTKHHPLLQGMVCTQSIYVICVFSLIKVLQCKASAECDPRQLDSIRPFGRPVDSGPGGQDVFGCIPGQSTSFWRPAFASGSPFAYSEANIRRGGCEQWTLRKVLMPRTFSAKFRVSSSLKSCPA